MRLEVDYVINDNSWNNYIDENSIDDFILKIFNTIINILEYKLNRKNTIELSITFTNDKEIQEINKNYRNVDKPTNVLSFPLFEKEFTKAYKALPYMSLGDIILSIETLKKESEEQNKTFKDHLTHLIVHSILHLFGFDHIKDEEADIMENLEIKILDKLSIQNPYL
jgi:probable rRNA maturation factor